MTHDETTWNKGRQPHPVGLSSSHRSRLTLYNFCSNVPTSTSTFPIFKCSHVHPAQIEKRSLEECKSADGVENLRAVSEKHVCHCSEQKERKDQILSNVRTMLHFPVELFHGYFCHGKCTTNVKKSVSGVSFKRCPAKKKLTTFGNITNKWVRTCSHMNLKNNKFPQGTHNLQYTVQYAVVFSMGFPRHLTCCNAFRCMWKLKRQGALEADGQRKSEKYQKKLM